jgi:hypothetical protein
MVYRYVQTPAFNRLGLNVPAWVGGKPVRNLKYKPVGVLEHIVPELNNIVYRLDGRTARGIDIIENRNPCKRAQL